LACGVCGSSLTFRRNGARPEYQCSRFIRRGKEACRGIGGRKKPLVERVQTDIVRPAIDGDVKRRALAVAREKLLAQADVPSERDAIAAALQDAEREGASLARAIQKGGNLEAFLEAAKANDAQKKQLRARLARLDASPTAALDGRRKLAEIERRLEELARALDQGGIAARPAVQAVLQGRRLQVTPVVVDGERRWAIHGWIHASYVTTLDEGVQRCDESPTRPSPPPSSAKPTRGGGSVPSQRVLLVNQ
jgi:Skp family chaperone for outer membrane proteins